MAAAVMLSRSSVYEMSGARLPDPAGLHDDAMP
jgi:hypothetical protein